MFDFWLNYKVFLYDKIESIIPPYATIIKY